MNLPFNKVIAALAVSVSLVLIGTVNAHPPEEIMCTCCTTPKAESVTKAECLSFKGERKKGGLFRRGRKRLGSPEERAKRKADKQAKFADMSSEERAAKKAERAERMVERLEERAKRIAEREGLTEAELEEKRLEREKERAQKLEEKIENFNKLTDTEKGKMCACIDMKRAKRGTESDTDFCTTTCSK